MDNKIKSEFEKIKIPSELDMKIQASIMLAEFERNSLKKRWPRKGIFVACSAVLIIGLLIGSAFLSPTMANIVTKIPYLGNIFESKQIINIISEELDVKGYQTTEVSIQFNSNPSINITLQGDEEYFASVKKDVRELIEEILQFRGYDGYKLNLSHEKNITEDNASSNSTEQTKMFQEIYKKAKERNLELIGIGVRPDYKKFIVNIPSSSDSETDLEELILSVAESYGWNKYLVEFEIVDMEKQKQAHNWNEIISVISEGLIGNSESHVKKVGYSNNKQPFTIYIYTTLNSLESQEKDQVVEIENMIDELINSDKAQELIKGEEYQVIIKNKDNKQIN